MTISEAERAAVLKVMENREKDCVSDTSVVDAVVNPKYFYGDDKQK
jgi:hypothetical protein